MKRKQILDFFNPFNWFKLATDQSNPAHEEGTVFYDNTKNALSYYNENSDVTINVGQELVFPVVNNSGVTITNGDIVTPDATGIVKADRRYKNKSRLLAVATCTMLDGESGYVTRLGQVGGLDTSAYGLGQILYLGEDGAFTTTLADDGAYNNEVAVVDVIDNIDGVVTVDPQISSLTVETTDTNGLPADQRVATSMNYVTGTRTFTIAPTGTMFHYYTLGEKYEKISAQSIVWPDVEGLHFFYFEGNTLKVLTNPSVEQILTLIDVHCFVAELYWNATDSQVVFDLTDERHGISMSPGTHKYLHITRGAQFGSGYGLANFVVDGNGSLDTHAQFSIASGHFYDEDVAHTFAGKSVGGTTIVGYLLGASGDFRSDSTTNFAVLGNPAGTIYYNEWTGATWQLTEVGNNNFCLYHIFATNGVNEQVISIMGQNEYATLSAARAGANSEISNIIAGINLQESVPIATIIFKANSGYTNTVSAAIQSTDLGDDYIDWRVTELAQGASPASHSNLTNVEQAASGVQDGHISDGVQTIFGAKTFKNIGTTIQSFTPTGATQTIDWNSGAYSIVTTTSATGNITLTLNNPVAGGSYAIELVQGATPRNIIFPAGTIQAGGGDVTVIGEASANQLITMVYNGSNYIISVESYS